MVAIPHEANFPGDVISAPAQMEADWPVYLCIVNEMIHYTLLLLSPLTAGVAYIRVFIFY